MRPLTPKQRAFADAILDGKQPSDAHKAAGYALSSVRIVSVAAQRTLKHPSVQAYIAKHREKAQKRKEWTRDEMIRTLREIAEDDKSPKAARTGAIAQASRMLGFDAPQKGEVSGGISIRWEE